MCLACIKFSPPDFEQKYLQVRGSTRVQGSHAGDEFVVVSLQEAQRTVDRALNRTVALLFQHRAHTARTPAELLGNLCEHQCSGGEEMTSAGRASVYQTNELDLHARSHSDIPVPGRHGAGGGAGGGDLPADTRACRREGVVSPSLY